MTLSNKEKEDQIDLYTLELRQIFLVEFDDSSSPLYNMIKCNKAALEHFLNCNLGIRSLAFTLWSLLNNRGSKLKAEADSENMNRVFELVDNIVDMMHVKNGKIRSVLSNLLPLPDNIDDVAYDHTNVKTSTSDPIFDDMYRLLFPSEKERLFSDWLQSLLNLLPPKCLVVFTAPFKMFVKELQLTDSDREASNAIIKRIKEDSRK